MFSNVEITYIPNTNSLNKVEQVTVGLSNVYFIKTYTGYILVDTGFPNEGKNMDEVFIVTGIDPVDVDLIILTHGHMDHTGDLAYVKQITGAEILCHESLSAYLKNGQGEEAVAQDGIGNFLNFLTGVLMFFTDSGQEIVKPDILIADTYDLRQHGISGKVISTPGHTKGSITIILDTGETLVGDMVRGESPDIHFGSFYEDEITLIKSINIVAEYESRIIYLSHGNAIDNNAFKNTIITVSD